MKTDLSKITNPVIDEGPAVAARDPALVFEDGVFRCFYTRVVKDKHRYRLSVVMVKSPDLVAWSSPEVLTDSDLNYSSPGNIIRKDGQWILCVQSYPIEPGQTYGSEQSRLWLMRSQDLQRWTAPEPMHPAGCQAHWTTSHRQIDPYLVEHQGKYWCFYKTSGQLGLLVSENLTAWREALPQRPVFSSRDTPDGASIENPCVVPTEKGFVLFFAPCRKDRGIGMAYSDDLLNWRDIHYLDFPALPWANNGPTAAMVLDTRKSLGVWLMTFHGEQSGEGHHAHSAALGLAWSADLEHWQVP